MNVRIITAPHLGANDTEARLVAWLEKPGSKVKRGAPVCELETTKATIEVESPANGFLHVLVEAGATVAAGAPVALLAEEAGFDLAGWKDAQEGENGTTEGTYSRKAQLLLKRHGFSEQDLPAPVGARLGEADVEAFLQARNVREARLGLGTTPRLAIVGGVSGGGALIVIDSARRMSGLLPVAVYDRDSQFQGQSVLGIPVVGTIESRLEQDYSRGMFDYLVIAFNRDLAQRDNLFNDLVERGYRFANVIDPNADVRADVSLGEGNVLLGNSYVGACSQIGSNNFISANVALEHGNIVGNSCSFGPGVFTSGNVTIGDRVRFGTGIHIEPGLEIGSDAVIGSGQTVVSSVEQGKLLTSRAKG